MKYYISIRYINWRGVTSSTNLQDFIASINFNNHIQLVPKKIKYLLLLVSSLISLSTKFSRITVDIHSIIVVFFKKYSLNKYLAYSHSYIYCTLVFFLQVH